MRYRKLSLFAWSSCLQILILSSASILPFLVTPSTATTHEHPVKQQDPNAPGKTSAPTHPVIAAVYKQLGIKRTQLDTPTNNHARNESTSKSASPIKNALVKITPPKKLKKHPPAPVKTDTQALKEFYQQPARQPLWVSKEGLLIKTLLLIEEFKNAGAYGLRPKDFIIPTFPSQTGLETKDKMSGTQLATLETSISKAVLKYTRYARGGRIDPKKLSRFQDRGPTLPDPTYVLKTIAKTDKPVVFLRSFHPQHPQFKALRKRLQDLSNRQKNTKQTTKKKAIRFPSKGPTLRFGVKHLQVSLLRTRLGLKKTALNENTKTFDKEILAAVKAFQKSKNLIADGVVGRGTRRALAGVQSKKPNLAKLQARLLINMERWRWMPKRMQGNNNIYVWANVPELRIRIIKDQKAVFTERVIAGKRGKQSPMFSDKIEWIEFNPTWFIPNSIKVADILPSLRRKGRVMSRYHLRLNCGKFGNDFSSIDWSKVDIRKCSVTQPAGVKSVLGKLKFKFPNKHSVYMHDTLTPGLFNQKHRILSHGCIRVRNPRRMAEVLLANDKGMSSKRVGSLLARRGLHTEHLIKPIPVHITYFSTRVKKDGSLSHHPDYYGHDKRLAQALLGKGHLFKGAVYGGSSRYRRKRPRPKPVAPTRASYFPEQ